MDKIHHPHGTKFEYDHASISSCASSLLARSLIGVGRGGQQNNEGVNNESSPFQNNLRNHHPRQQIINSTAANRDCKYLFVQHAKHYQRPPLTNEEEQFWMSWTHSDETSNTANTNTTPDNNLAIENASSRIKTFIRSVLFVHEHNNINMMENKHRVALNRFSDMLAHELPLMSHSDSIEDDVSSTIFEAVQSPSVTLESFLPLHREIFDYSSKEHGGQVFVTLDDDETIMKYGGKIRQLQEEQRLIQSSSDSDNDDIPTNNNNMGASYSSNVQRLLDSWWWIGGDHNHIGDSSNQHLAEQVVDNATPATSNPLTRHPKSEEDDDSSLLDKENKMGGLVEETGSSDGGSDDWETYLNWATTDNPDGVAVVHEVMDQGLCGSCWAVSATGTLEASIARNMAYIAYEDAYSSVTSRKHKSDELLDPRSFSVAAAQQIEQQSINTADLSVQELVDCDTRYDQGCAGGNPLLAFYFLHRFGVTSTKNYPYTGTAGKCNYHKVDQPIATVKTWGILTPDHENNMEKVLRYIGPVAVGLIGADPAFLSYESGIFVSSKGGKCDDGQADHAMLIVGYGQEKSKDGTVQKYWIARNSWGSGWGENGYVRVARAGGRKGHKGVCGIARSPSVALGGMFTKDVILEKSSSGVYGINQYGEKTDYDDSGSRLGDKSLIARASSQIQSTIHRIRARLGFMQKGIMMSTMEDHENNHVGVALGPSFAGLLAMLAVCLLLTQLYHKRRGRRQRNIVIHRLSSGEEESIATSWSTRVLCNGIHGDAIINEGERMHLLESDSCTRYT